MYVHKGYVFGSSNSRSAQNGDQNKLVFEFYFPSDSIKIMNILKNIIMFLNVYLFIKYS